MTSYLRSCIERAELCAALAQDQHDSDLRQFLERLGRQWLDAAKQAEKPPNWEEGD